MVPKNLVILLLLLPPWTWAQVNTDSLFGVWQNTSKPDTARLKAIHSYVDAKFLYSNPDSAIYYTSQELQLAKSANHRKHEGDALTNLGIANYVAGEREMVLDFFRQSYVVFSDIDHQMGMANALNNMANIYLLTDQMDSAVHNYLASIEIKLATGDTASAASSYLNIGMTYQRRGGLEAADEYFQKAIDLYNNGGNQTEIHKAYIALGDLYIQQGKIDMGIEHYLKALAAAENLNDLYSQGLVLNKLAALYHDQEEPLKSEKYYLKSMAIYGQMDSRVGLAQAKNNLGFLYATMGRLDEAVDLYHEVLEVFDSESELHSATQTRANLADIYLEREQYSKAYELYMQSFEERKKLGNSSLIGVINTKLAEYHLTTGNPEKAISYGKEGYRIARENGDVPYLKTAANTLYRVYKSLGRKGEALDFYEMYVHMRDSIVNDKNTRAIIQQRFQYEYNKKALADSIREAQEDAIFEAELAAEKAISTQRELERDRATDRNIYLALVLVLALVLGGFLFNRFRVTAKQKEIISDQKAVVDQAYSQLEEKNTEILDSINYAKRIQAAILPPQKLVKEYLQNSFILYKPKDIVAGDFYWMHSLPAGREHTADSVFFAAADCTGHGVPGAMVSVICNGGLNRSVREFGLDSPAQILDKTRELVIQEFEKSEEAVQDGMDIALCALRHTQPSGQLEGDNKMLLQFAGANNPLWIIRKNTDIPELIEIKGDKQPIGKYGDPCPFTQHEVILEQGDTVYIFSDGFADQFGGEKGKKLKASNFKKLLLSLVHEPMDRQKVLLDQAFETWRNDLEQLDDVCVIGVRV